MQICRKCSREVPKIIKQSHINPKLMYDGIFNEKGQAYMPDPKTKVIVPTQGGLWRTFLCPACEKEFEKDVTSACNLLTNKKPNSIQKRNLKVERLVTGNGEQWSGIDFREFQKFVFGVLLRAVRYASTPSELQCLPPENLYPDIREMYDNGSQLNDSLYPIGVTKLLGDDFQAGVRFPVLQNWVEFGVTVFMGGGYVFEVYMPESPEPPPGTMDIRLKVDGTLLVKLAHYKSLPWFKLFDDLEILDYRLPFKKRPHK